MKTTMVTILLVLISISVTVQTVSSEEYPILPVLMVPGLGGYPINFSTIKARLVRHGYPANWIYTIALTPNDMMCDPGHVEQIHTAVEKIITETGSQQIDLIGHSNGGVDNLNYMRYSWGTEYIRNWIALGSPLVVTCQGSFGMRPDDPTPGNVLYTSIYSAVDTVVPPRLSVLEGAQNIELLDVSHSGLLFDEDVFNYLLEALHGQGLNDNLKAAPGFLPGSSNSNPIAGKISITWGRLKGM